MELEEEDYQFFMVEVTPEAQPRLIADIFPTSIQWTPDSRRIMYGGTGGYFRFDVTTGTNEPLNIPAYEYLSWSPDGAQFTVHTECPCIGKNAELNLYTVETGDAQSVAEGYQIMAQSFSPDGQWVGYEWDSRFWGERISVVNVDTGQDIEVAAAEFGDLSLWGWSPDSAMVAYTVPSRRSGAYEEALHVVNIETAEDRMITDDQRYPIGWSSDSQWIAYLVDNDVVVIDDLVNDRALQIIDFDYVIGWRP
jgi:Tol biopolymer transport system component